MLAGLPLWLPPVKDGVVGRLLGQGGPGLQDTWITREKVSKESKSIFRLKIKQTVLLLVIQDSIGSLSELRDMES